MTGNQGLNPVHEAVHSGSRETKPTLMERAFSYWFDSFVYNQIWEDPRVDLHALQVRPDSRMMTIASGGCNVLTYLRMRPQAIFALDINRCHIYLTRLKLAALQTLPTYSDFFTFFGCADSSVNLNNYHTYVRQNLDSAAQAFWEGGSWVRKKVLGPRIEYFANNFYNYAKLGYLLRFCHRLARLLRKDPSRLLAANSLQEQQALFDTTIAPFLDNRLVKLIGTHPLILFSLGVPPRQLQRLRQEMNGDVICLYRERLRRLTCEFPIGENYFAWQALSRGYDRDNKRAVPEYLKEEHYATIKSQARVVTTLVTPVTKFLQEQPRRSLDCYVLLDAQDWMEPEQLEELWLEIHRTGRSGARIIFRSGASRSPIETALSPKLRQNFVYDEERSRELHKQDRSAIYGGFHIYRIPE